MSTINTELTPMENAGFLALQDFDFASAIFEEMEGLNATVDTTGTSADSTTSDQVDTTAAGNALLQQFLAADLVPYYDQPGYLQTSDVTFSCSGEASNFLSLLDDLADNYPSIQLQNFSITTRSFAAADGTSSSGSIYNVTLRVVLCDKGGVQP